MGTSTAEEGDIPSYGKEDPAREKDAQYTYTFTGWTPEVVAATQDATYTATYSTTVNTYTVTWVVDGAKTQETYEYGATPSYKGDIPQEPTPPEHCSFVWDWSPSITKVVGDAEYLGQRELHLDAKAFLNDKALPAYEVPDGVTMIGESAFSGCSKLTSLTIPSSVTDIGKNAFHGCGSMTIEYSGNEAQWDAIEGSSSLSKAHIKFSDGTSRLTEGFAYSEASGLGYTYVSASKAWALSSAPKDMASVSISSSVLGHPVTSIRQSVFSGHTGLTSVSIPSSIASIGKDAFSGCARISEVRIPSIESWLGISFASSLSNPLYSAAGKLYIGEATEPLTALTIPSRMTSIGNYVFYGYASLKSVSFPSLLSSIGKGAFHGCAGLASVSIPLTLSSIGEGAFSECSKTLTIEYPGTEDQWDGISGSSSVSKVCVKFQDGEMSYIDGVEYDYNPLDNEWSVTYAPSGLTKAVIKSDILGHPVASIGSEAFYNCGDLASVSIPVSVTSVGESAFPSSHAITIEYAGEEEDWDAVGGVSSLSKVLIKFSDGTYRVSDGCYYVDESGFGYTYSSSDQGWSLTHGVGLDTVVIPSEVIGHPVLSIGKEAFATLTSIGKLIISEGVKTIGESAFFGCNSLVDATIPLSVTAIEFDAFHMCHESLWIHYAGSKDQWKSIRNWSEIEAEIEYLGDHVEI